MNPNKILPLANHQTFSMKDIKNINIDYSFISIHLVKSESDSIELLEYMSRHDEKMLAQTSVNNGNLSISQGKFPLLLTLWFGRAELHIPEKYAGELNAFCSSGSIKTNDNWNFANVNLSSKSGSVKILDISSQNDVLLKASSGSVNAGHITAAANVEAEANSGSIKFETVTSSGCVNLENSSGSVSSGNINSASDVNISSKSGSLKLADIVCAGDVTLKSTSSSVHASKVSGKNINASSSSGSVKIEKITSEKIDATSTSGSVKIEELYGIFNLESSSGGVHIGGGVASGSARAKSGSVKISLQEITGNLQLSSSSGSVRLNIPQTSAFKFTSSVSSGSVKTIFNDILSFDASGKKATASYGANPQFSIDCATKSSSIHVDWI